MPAATHAITLNCNKQGVILDLIGINTRIKYGAILVLYLGVLQRQGPIFTQYLAASTIYVYSVLSRF